MTTAYCAFVMPYGKPARQKTLAIKYMFAIVACFLCSQTSTRPLAFQKLDLSVGKSLETGGQGSPASSGDPKGGGNGAGKAIVAGTGVVGAGAVASRGCRAAEDVEQVGARIGAVGAGAKEAEGLAALERGAALEGAATSRAALSGAAVVGGDFGEKAMYLDAIGSSIAKTSVGSDLSPLQMEIKWGTEPSFRAEAINELAETDPEALTAFAKGAKTNDGVVLKPVAHLYNELDPLVHEDDAIALAIQDDRGAVPDHTRLSPDANLDDADAQYQDRIRGIVSEVLDNLPQGAEQPTNAQLRAALTKALKPDPKWSYSFNVQSGKLTIKMRTAGGEISGEPNIYAIARRALFLTGLGTGITNRDEVVRVAKKYFAKSAAPSQPSHVRS